jgi:hypothetical protein
MTVANGATISFTLRIAAPQLEQGAFATSYIPTTSAAATRAVDVAVVTPISSFYNQSEGTLFAEHQRYASATSSFQGYSFATDANSTSNEIYLTQANSPSSVNTIAYLAAVATGETTRETFVGGLTMGQVTRLVAGIKSGEFFVGGRSDGGLFVSATNSNAHNPIAATRLRLGGRAGTSGAINGHIRKIAYWPRRLSNTLLQQLTT